MRFSTPGASRATQGRAADPRGQDTATRVLVIANRTADSAELRRQLLDRHRRGRITVSMLAAAI
ncbi:MAG: hypothetical protein ACR2J5_05345 [Geodermatophilaceae bacterium]